MRNCRLHTSRLELRTQPMNILDEVERGKSLVCDSDTLLQHQDHRVVALEPSPGVHDGLGVRKVVEAPIEIALVVRRHELPVEDDVALAIFSVLGRDPLLGAMNMPCSLDAGCILEYFKEIRPCA